MADKHRGFAGMDREQQRVIAVKGGRAAHNRHKWTHEEASAAGRKGAAASNVRRLAALRRP